VIEEGDMGDFEVDPAQLRVAARSAQQAADAVRKLELSRVTELAAALPGTQSAGTAGRLGPHWKGFTDNWAGGMDSYAKALTTSADDYEARDQGGAHGIRQAGGR
jgi:hypothetical protein